MVYALLTLSVMLMISGHLWKVKRWTQFISVYETPDRGNLLRSLAAGHAVNVIFPFRAGYVLRMFLSGKRMKNGYPFSIATVTADIYIDTLIVCFIYLSLCVFGICNEELCNTARNYGILLILIISGTCLISVFKKQTKKAIYWFASKFNQKIEFSVLYTFYLSILSMKDIIKKIDKKKLLFHTVMIWGSYAGSYYLFSRCLIKTGFSCNALYVFDRVFSNSVFHMADPKEQMLWTLYTVLPLTVCYGLAFLGKPAYSGRDSRILPQIHEKDKLAFLKVYFEDYDRDYIRSYLDINQDVSVVKDHSAGSNASTIMAITENGDMIFRKYAFGQDGKKLKDQVEWLHSHDKDLPLPYILSEKETDAYYSYDMHVYNHASGFFHYIHTMPVDASWIKLESALNDIRKNLHEKNSRQADQEAIKRYIDQKIIANYSFIKENGGEYIKKLEKYREIYINGVPYHTLRFYEEMLSKDHLLDVFRNDRCSDIHGDFTIENIICLNDNRGLSSDEYAGKIKPESYYFIDPNTGNIHDTPFQDYAKLLQSLHGGYEFRMMVSDVSVSENQVNFMMIHSEEYHLLYDRYVKYLEKYFSREEMRSIFYHEIAHWLRLMPYKIRKDKKMAVVFYCGLLFVLNEVWKMEEGAQDEKKTCNF